MLCTSYLSVHWENSQIVQTISFSKEGSNHTPESPLVLYLTPSILQSDPHNACRDSPWVLFYSPFLGIWFWLVTLCYVFPYFGLLFCFVVFGCCLTSAFETVSHVVQVGFKLTMYLKIILNSKIILTN